MAEGRFDWTYLPFLIAGTFLCSGKKNQPKQAERSGAFAHWEGGMTMRLSSSLD